MAQILFGIGLAVGFLISFGDEGNNVFLALVHGCLLGGFFWGVGWWINSKKNSL
jgi:hypothetical protein